LLTAANLISRAVAGKPRDAAVNGAYVIAKCFKQLRKNVETDKRKITKYD